MYGTAAVTAAVVVVVVVVVVIVLVLFITMMIHKIEYLDSFSIHVNLFCEYL